MSLSLSFCLSFWMIFRMHPCRHFRPVFSFPAPIRSRICRIHFLSSYIPLITHRFFSFVAPHQELCRHCAKFVNIWYKDSISCVYLQLQRKRCNITYLLCNNFLTKKGPELSSEPSPAGLLLSSADRLPRLRGYPSLYRSSCRRMRPCSYWKDRRCSYCRPPGSS